MGFFDGIRNALAQRSEPVKRDQAAPREYVCVGAEDMTSGEVVQSFSNDNITFSGNLSGYDYQSILKDKQKNIVKLYELSDYFSDADPIYRGIIKHVYAPYASSAPYYLSGGTEKTRAKYMAYYDRINLKDKWRSIALQLFKYANVYIYLLDGNIVTLPPHKCRITNMSLNGDALVEFNIRSITQSLNAGEQGSDKKFYKDGELENLLKGYPPEVAEGVKANREWVQLDPANTFTVHTHKEDWIRYSVPMIAACLPALAKKALISNYEDATLSLGTRGFVHVKYGESSKDGTALPSRPELSSVQKLFSRAMSGYPLVVTNHLSQAQFVQSDMQDLFQWNKYQGVNENILSAGGVSGIIVSGISQDGSTFASAQVSMKTVAVRIQQAMDAFADVMNKINMRVNGDEKGVSKTRSSSVPTFRFMPLSMDGHKELEQTCLALWKEGVLSHETMMNTLGYDVNEEAARRSREKKAGIYDLLVPRDEKRSEETGEPSEDGEETRGRKELDDDERNSDPEASVRGKQPKPSNPEGTPIE